MLKKIVLVFFILITINTYVYSSTETVDTAQIINEQSQALDIPSFLNESESYIKSAFPDMDMSSMFNSAITGKIDNKTIWSSILNLFAKEIVSAIKLLAGILVIVVLHSIIKSISDGLENKGVSQIAYYVQYIAITALVMANFSELLTSIKASIDNLVGLSYSLIPILLALLITTGSVVSVAVVEPIILFSIVFIANIIQTVIIPIVLVSTALSIVSNISDKVNVEKIAKFFKSSIGWFLGVVITIFVAILSLEGTLSSSVDGIASKTTKAVVSNFVPVVGKALGDSIDTVFGCANILKNAVGVVGIVIVVGICALPILKLSVLTMAFSLTVALAEPISDKKIVKLLEQMGDTFKILLAIICFVAVMLIIGIAIIIRISNSGMMYR